MNIILFRAFIAGFVTLSLEILAPRLLAPYFGVSHLTWTVLICVFLTAISIGYSLSAFTHLKIKVITAINVFGLSLLLFYPSLFEMTSSLTSSRAFNLLVSALFFTPCGILLSYLFPFYVSSLAFSPRKASGLVSLFGTMGSVIGAIITGTLFFKYLSNFQIIWALILISLFLFPIKKTISALLIAGCSLIIFCQNSSSYKSIYQPIRLEKKNGHLLLWTGTIAHNKINLKTPKIPIARYTLDSLKAIQYTVNFKNVLVLGAGANTFGSAILEKCPDISVDAVEIDPVIKRIALEKFSANPKANFIIEEARAFLKENTKKYDVIYLDSYHGIAPAPHLFTKEYFELVQDSLTKNGIVIANIPNLPDISRTDTLLSTFQKSFTSTLETRSKYSIVLVGSNTRLKKNNSFFDYLSPSEFSEIATDSTIIHTDAHPLWF